MIKKDKAADETVTITKEEYEALKEDRRYLAHWLRWLHCLESNGVENWDGYESSQEMFKNFQD